MLRGYLTQNVRRLSVAAPKLINRPRFLTTLKDLFKKQVAENPDKLAVDIFQNKSEFGRRPIEHKYTYSEMDKAANRWARYLKAQGVRHRDDVVVCLDEAPENVIPSFLGIVYGGGVYTPLRPIKQDVSRRRNPWQEKKLINQLEKLNPKLVLTNATQLPLLKKLKLTKVKDYSEVQQELKVKDLAMLDERTVTPWSYIVATSGSTGEPKLIKTSSDCMVSRVKGFRHKLQLTSKDRISQIFPFSYDASLMEMIMAFGTGSCLCPMPYNVSGISFVNSFKDQRITTATFFPHLLPWFSKHSTYKIEKIISMGDKGNQQLFEDFLQTKYAPSILVNGYGPSEVGGASSMSYLEKGFEYVLLGEPMPSVVFRVYPRSLGEDSANESKLLYQAKLNEENEIEVGCNVPSSRTEMGELYISDTQNGVGEYLDPNLNAEKFKVLPVGDRTLRFFKTGDQVNVRPGFGLEFIERYQRVFKDNMAHWINLPYIEKTLEEFFRSQNNFPELSAVIVDVNRRTQHIVVVLVRNTNFIDETQQKKILMTAHQHLLDNCEPHMVPSHWEVQSSLASLPDRSRIIQQIQAGEITGKIIPVAATGLPRELRGLSEIETALIAIWQDVLQIKDSISEHHRFYDHLNGTSLNYFRMSTEVEKRFDIQINYSEFYRHQTIAYLYRQIFYKDSKLEVMVSSDRSKKVAGKLPVFFIHAGDGQRATYRSLREKLFIDRQVYIIEAADVDGLSIMDETVDEMAIRYANQIAKELQKTNERDCIVGGWSAGGIIGLEVQRHLKNDYGLNVTNILIDSESPHYWHGLKPDEYNVRIVDFTLYMYDMFEGKPKVKDPAIDALKEKFKNFMTQHEAKTSSEQINHIIAYVSSQVEFANSRKKLLTALRIAKAVTIHHSMLMENQDFSFEDECLPDDNYLFVAAPTKEEFFSPVDPKTDRGVLGWPIKKEDKNIVVVPVTQFNPTVKQVELPSNESKANLHLKILIADEFPDLLMHTLNVIDQKSSVDRIVRFMFIPIFDASMPNYYDSHVPNLAGDEQELINNYVNLINQLFRLSSSNPQFTRYEVIQKALLSIPEVLNHYVSNDWSRQIKAIRDIKEIIAAFAVFEKHAAPSLPAVNVKYALLALHNLLALLYRIIRSKEDAFIHFTYCINLLQDINADKGFIEKLGQENFNKIKGTIYLNVGYLLNEIGEAVGIFHEIDNGRVITKYFQNCDAQTPSIRPIIEPNDRDRYQFFKDFGQHYFHLACDLRKNDLVSILGCSYSLVSVCFYFREKINFAQRHFDQATTPARKEQTEKDIIVYQGRLADCYKNAKKYIEDVKILFKQKRPGEEGLPCSVLILEARLYKHNEEYEKSLKIYDDQIKEIKDSLYIYSTPLIDKRLLLENVYIMLLKERAETSYLYALKTTDSKSKVRLLNSAIEDLNKYLQMKNELRQTILEMLKRSLGSKIILGIERNIKKAEDLLLVVRAELTKSVNPKHIPIATKSDPGPSKTPRP